MELVVLVSIVIFIGNRKHRPWKIYGAALRALHFLRMFARTPMIARENKTMGKVMVILRNVLLTIDNIFSPIVQQILYVS